MPDPTQTLRNTKKKKTKPSVSYLVMLNVIHTCLYH